MGYQAQCIIIDDSKTIWYMYYNLPTVYMNISNMKYTYSEVGVQTACSQAPSEKSGKGPGSVSVYFLSTITSQNFEEPIRLQNETTWNVIPSHAHEAKSADYAIW